MLAGAALPLNSGFLAGYVRLLSLLLTWLSATVGRKSSINTGHGRFDGSPQRHFNGRHLRDCVLVFPWPLCPFLHVIHV